MAKIALVSLGCPKNLVDSETAVGELSQAGHEIAGDASGADAIVVNTCGFIESAREESIDAILQAVECKRSGRCRAVIVIGCLSQRFAGDLARELGDVDAFLGVGHTGEVAAAVESALAGRRIISDAGPPAVWVEPECRVRSTPPWTAYLKISDGCDNRCAYCAIPDIRGPFRSRPRELIVDEARRLADAGVKELILVGQDSTQYGADWGRPGSLPGLLEELDSIDGVRWIRVMYCYPSKIDAGLVRAVTSLPNVAPYLDIPMQHADDSILRAMNRHGTAESYLRLIDQLRSACPDVALRSTFIVGFPGETEAAFRRLLRFLERARLDRVGAFVYSVEEGTPAASLKPRPDRGKSARRLDELMRLQQGISLERNRSLIGRELEVLVEARTDDGAVGRSYRDAPEIDGLVYVRGCRSEPGEFVRATVSGATHYDLTAGLSGPCTTG